MLAASTRVCARSIHARLLKAPTAHSARSAARTAGRRQVLHVVPDVYTHDIDCAAAAESCSKATLREVQGDAGQGTIQPYSVNSGPSGSWDRLTRVLLHISNLLLAVLAVQEICSNSCAPHLPVLDYLTSCYCFVVLTGVFLEDREVQAATLNATSAFTSLALVVQAWQRQAVSAGTITVVALGATLSLILLLAKWLNLRIANGAGYLTWHVWPAWQDLLAVFGAGMVWQVGWMMTSPVAAHAPTLWPAWCGSALTGAAAVACRVLDHLDILPRAWRDFWADLPAWCATLLLMMMSAAQLVHVLVLPVGSLAAGMRTLLQALAMGLMVPRALRISNLMFFTGVSFCALASWLAMHVVFFRSGLPSSWAASLALLLPANAVSSWLVLSSLKQDCRHKGLPSPACLLERQHMTCQRQNNEQGPGNQWDSVFKKQAGEAFKRGRQATDLDTSISYRPIKLVLLQWCQ